MKGSKWQTYAVVAIALFAVFQVVSVILAEVCFLPDDAMANDVRMRRNEICCAHQGVNSFRIWNREATLPGFAPLDRPDRESVDWESEKAGRVHAYPPWHTAFFWFYGWLPEILCVTLMSVVFGLCCCLIVHECIRLAKDRFAIPGLVACSSLAMISVATIECWAVLNYGVLVLSAFLLMNKALEKGHDVLAGLAWAVMMIKPQIGLLFVWPLFWHRRYRTIATAIAVCLAGTVFTSFAVHESPVALILQIPEIGRPYGSGFLMDKMVKPFVGDCALFLVPALFFVLVGVMTVALRGNRDFLVSCIPVVLVIPIWTYSVGYDHVILLPAFILLAGHILETRRWDALTIAVCACLAVLFFMRAWGLLSGFGVFDPTGIGWIYRLAECSSYALMLAIAALFVRDSRHSTPPAYVRLS